MNDVQSFTTRQGNVQETNTGGNVQSAGKQWNQFSCEMFYIIRTMSQLLYLNGLICVAL